MYEIQVRKMDGEWRSLHPPVPENAPPYRYEDRRDAEVALDRLYPDHPADKRRVVDAATGEPVSR